MKHPETLSIALFRRWDHLGDNTKTAATGRPRKKDPRSSFRINSVSGLPLQRMRNPGPCRRCEGQPDGLGSGAGGSSCDSLKGDSAQLSADHVEDRRPRLERPRWLAARPISLCDKRLQFIDLTRRRGD